MRGQTQEIINELGIRPRILKLYTRKIKARETKDIEFGVTRSERTVGSAISDDQRLTEAEKKLCTDRVSLVEMIQFRIDIIKVVWKNSLVNLEFDM